MFSTEKVILYVGYNNLNWSQVGSVSGKGNRFYPATIQPWQLQAQTILA